MNRFHTPSSRIVSTLLLAAVLSGPVIAGPGSVDGTFIPPAPNGWVHDIAVQPDGKILVAGEFTVIGGVSRSRIARLFADGTVDPSFDPGVGPNNLIHSFAVQPNGQIVIVGEFSSVSGAARNRYARLNTNGTHDATFAVTQPFLLTVTSPTGPRAIALPDGKSLITGMQVYFTVSPFVMRAGMIRLNADGSCDTTFNLTAVSGTVISGAVAPGGKYLVCGSFTTTSPAGYTNLARLDTNGVVDATFIAPTRTETLSIVRALSSGQLLTVGTGGGSNYVRRLLDTGAEAPGFTAPYFNANLFGLCAMPDDRICVGGDFDHVNTTHQSIKAARINADGSFDATFDVGVGGSSSVLSMAAQPDGKVLVGGAFVCFGGLCPTNLVRLNGNPGGLIAAGPTYGSGIFSLTVPTVAGKNYTLQYVTTLGSTNWNALPPPTAGDGTVKSLYDLGATNTQRYYRVLEN
jgi:uncharacterized delta-60 repeat protein